VASKSAQHEPVKGEVIEELLDVLDKTLERVKVLYEQFFLGIQKQPPAHLHTDIERKLRDLTQMQIRNTAQRYRFATLQQKFGSYNSYWRRTLRQIENGTYLRNLSKISRQAAMTGEEIPEEILAAMPKRMREQVKRDREAALALHRRREQTTPDPALGDAHGTDASPAAGRKTATGAHVLDDDDDFDLDAYFASVTSDNAPVAPPRAASAVEDHGPTVPMPTFPEAPTPPTSTTRMPTFPEAPPTSTARVPTFREAPAPQTSTTRMPTFPEAQPTSRMPAAPEPIAAARTPVPSAMRPPPSPIPRPMAPSQISRPIPVMPGSASGRDVPVESMAGPFPRIPTPAAAPPSRPTPMPQPGERPLPPATVRPAAPAPARGTMPGEPPRPTPPRPATEAGAAAPVRVGPPPGMTEADVNALYAKYVKAKEAIGEPAGPGAYGKLLRTINTQAPKIMEQYKAKGVDFQVVVKDNQVVIRAKPKP